MEEKKQCTCGCEAKEQKPTELTEEEMEKTGGGMVVSSISSVWSCKGCGTWNNAVAFECRSCGQKRPG